MDCNHAYQYNYLLTRRCSCGGEGEMLVDFMADFIVRCRKCHLSTHAYIGPEDAAAHWNRGDDIMPNIFDIFLDDPEGNLQGEVVAIHISDDNFMGISHQSCDFMEAVFEYTDKKYLFEHEKFGEEGAVNIGELESFNPCVYRYTIRPGAGEKIFFEKIIYSEDGNIEGLAFRWENTWLYVFTDECNLVLTRSSFDMSDPKGWPAAEEPSLFENRSAFFQMQEMNKDEPNGTE